MNTRTKEIKSEPRGFEKANMGAPYAQLVIRKLD